MQVRVGNVTSTVVSATAQERHFLSSLLTVTVPNHEYMHAFRNGHWDGKKRFYSAEGNSFPSGFLSIVQRQWDDKKWDLTLHEGREGILVAASVFRDDRLRAYQSEAIRGLLGGMLHGMPWPRGVLKAPTGSGKTAVASRLIDAIGQPTLYIVERRNLLRQTVDAFRQWSDLDTGVIGDGEFDPKTVTFAMMQTLRTKLKSVVPFLKTIRVLVVDECHHLSSNTTYHDVAVRCTNAVWRYGVSATPLSRNDLGDVYLIGDTGDVLVDIDRQQLEDEGYVAKAVVTFFKINSPVAERLDYRTAYDRLIVWNDERNGKIIWCVKRLLEHECRVLILVKLIEHGELLHRALQQEGINADFIHGTVSVEERSKVLRQFSQKNRVLISSTISDEGIDLPTLNAVILAGGGDSKTKEIQRIGRALRPKEGDNRVFVVDFLDRTNKYLLRHANHRLAICRSEGFDVQVKE